MTPDEQLDLWLKGESVHNPDRDECCPDFSCCKPDLVASQAEKEAFVAAYKIGDEQSTTALLAGFAGALLRSMDPDATIKIVGIEVPDA